MRKQLCGLPAQLLQHTRLEFKKNVRQLSARSRTEANIQGPGPERLNTVPSLMALAGPQPTSE